MSVNCQYTVLCSDDSLRWTIADLSRPTDTLFRKKTIYFYPLFPVFDPIIFSCRFFPCFFEVININFSNINAMHLMTTIQIHIFMADAKRKKGPAFCLRKQKPQEHHPLLGPNQTHFKWGFARAYFKWARFFFPSNFDRITCRKWQVISQIGSLILFLQLFQHFCHDRQCSFPLQPSLPSFFQILFCFINLNQRLKYNIGFHYHNEFRVISCPNRC